MAVVQAGMTLVRGAGLVGLGLICSRIPKVAEFLSELPESLREKGANTAESGAAVDNATNALSSELAKLTREVRQFKYQDAVILQTGSGGAGSALIVPAAAVGAVGYCYMWWNGISFSSLMYVTKSNMATAVASMTKHLEQVQSSLAAAKKHLSQRIQRVDDKLEQQKEISGQIKDQVTDAKMKIKNIGSDMYQIRIMATGLVQKMDSIEAKQDYSNEAVNYLCKFIEQGGERLPEHMLVQEGSQQTVRPIVQDRNKQYSSKLPGFGQLLALDSASPTAQRMLRSSGISAARLILP